jgi:hypothetical protein
MKSRSHPYNHHGVHQLFEYTTLVLGRIIKVQAHVEEVFPLSHDSVIVTGHNVSGSRMAYMCTRSEVDRGYCDKVAITYQVA